MMSFVPSGADLKLFFSDPDPDSDPSWRVLQIRIQVRPHKLFRTWIRIIPFVLYVIKLIMSKVVPVEDQEEIPQSPE